MTRRKNDVIRNNSIAVTNGENAFDSGEKICCKIFFKRDIAVYLLLAVLIFILFSACVFPTLADKGSRGGFTVTRDGETVLVFTAKNSAPFEIYPDFTQQVEIDFSSQAEGIYIVKIYSSADKDGYNVLTFNAAKISVKITESTCSESKDCVYFPTLTDSGSIYCAPHGLKVTPTGGSGYIPPTTG